MARSLYAININDGRIVFRTTATDALVGLYRKVSNEVAMAIDKGEVKAMDVVNAIMSNERYSGEFDWKEFQKQQKALNMRVSDVEMNDSEEQATEKLPDDEPGDTLSLSDVKKSTAERVAAKATRTAKTVKKVEKVEKVEKTVAEDDNPFSAI